MPRRIKTRRPIAASPAPHAGTPESTERAVDALRRDLERATSSPFSNAVEIVVDDFVDGTLKLDHGLGRTPRGVYVLPDAAAAGFAVGYDRAQPGNPHPDRQVHVSIAGSAGVGGGLVWLW